MIEEQNKHELISSSPSGLRKIENSKYGASFHLAHIDFGGPASTFPRVTLELGVGNPSSKEEQTNAKIN